MSGSARTNLLVTLQQHTRLVVLLGMLGVVVALLGVSLLVYTGSPYLGKFAPSVLMVGVLLDHVAHRYVADGRPRRALKALSYVVFAVSVGLAWWPNLAR